MIDVIEKPVNVEVTEGIRSDKDIIDSYINGTLTGIYVRDNSFFVRLRVTGLGVTKRLDEDKSMANLAKALNNFKDIPEHYTNFEGLCKLAREKGLQPHNFLEFKMVDRKEQDFASPDILELYAGLPIILDHPNDNGLLSFDNLCYNSIVGSVIKAFKLNNAVFAVARIYDLSILDKFKEFKSTSPAVVSVEIEDNGTHRELPYIFNHLAFVSRGHWDVISDYAIDNTKITIEKGEEMPITEVVEKVDAITDQVATPETKDIKVDDEFKSELGENPAIVTTEVADEEVENVDEDEVVEVADEEELNEKVDFSPIRAGISALGSLKGDSDEVEKVDNDEIIEVKDEEEVAQAVEAVKADKADEAVKADNADEAKKADCDKPIVTPSGNAIDPAFAKDVIHSGITDVTKSIECDEDKEREALIDTMRKVVDSVALRDVKMPYIEGRKKPSVVIRQILRANRGYIDSKYQDIIDRDVSYKNYSLCVDAFNNMIGNIKAIDKANKRDFEVARTQTKGWVATQNPNILVDKSF